ncbi:hypothetical protein [Vibrio alfacsensis]|uniref:hypothetical protein n=1 Tax=Vibrio alfacsensis TaxID=1074311 RepID=UPI004068BC9F
MSKTKTKLKNGKDGLFSYTRKERSDFQSRYDPVEFKAVCDAYNFLPKQAATAKEIADAYRNLEPSQRKTMSDLYSKYEPSAFDAISAQSGNGDPDEFISEYKQIIEDCLSEFDEVKNLTVPCDYNGALHHCLGSLIKEVGKDSNNSVLIHAGECLIRLNTIESEKDVSHNNSWVLAQTLEFAKVWSSFGLALYEHEIVTGQRVVEGGKKGQSKLTRGEPERTKKLYKNKVSELQNSGKRVLKTNIYNEIAKELKCSEKTVRRHLKK